jgi:hypothetical protein
MVSTRGITSGAAGVVFVALVLAGIVLVNLIAARGVHRIDLTDDQRFTLQETSKEIAAELPGPVHIKLFFTPGLPGTLNQMRRDVADLLDTFETASDGKLTYEFVDTGASDEARESASFYGIPAWELESRADLSVRLVHTGVVAIYEPTGDDEEETVEGEDDGAEGEETSGAEGERWEVIEALLPGMNYEYELARVIRRVTREGGPPTLGVVYGDGGFFDPLLEQAPDPRQPFVDIEARKAEYASQLAELFEDLYQFRFVDIREGPIPTEGDEAVDGLMVIGPTRQYSDEMLERLDQYIMSGHPVALFVSPYKREQPVINDPNMPPIPPMPAENETGIDRLLHAYGVQLNRDAVFDLENGQISAELRQEGRLGGMQAYRWVPFKDPRLPELTNIDENSVLMPNVPLIALLPLDRRNPLSQSTLSEFPHGLSWEYGRADDPELEVRECDEGDASACSNLGVMLVRDADNLDGDLAEIERAVAATCEGVAEPVCEQAEALSLSRPSGALEALAAFESACEAGVQRACRFEVDADNYIQLLRTTDLPDAAHARRRAVELFEDACGEGDAAGCNNLAAMLRTGESGGDPVRAVELALRACRAGNTTACIAAGETRVVDVMQTAESAYRFAEPSTDGEGPTRLTSLRLENIAPYLPSAENPFPSIDLEHGPFAVGMTVEGRLNSAFPEGAEEPGDEGGAEADEGDDEAAQDEGAERHADHTDQARLLVVANGYWVQALFSPNDPLLSRMTQSLLQPAVRNTVRYYRQSNELLLRNTADWLAQETGLVSIRSRGQARFVSAPVSESDQTAYKWLNIVGVPLAFSFLGLCGFLVRQARRSAIESRYAPRSS